MSLTYDSNPSPCACPSLGKTETALFMCRHACVSPGEKSQPGIHHITFTCTFAGLPPLDILATDGPCKAHSTASSPPNALHGLDSNTPHTQIDVYCSICNNCPQQRRQAAPVCGLHRRGEDQRGLVGQVLENCQQGKRLGLSAAAGHLPFLQGFWKPLPTPTTPNQSAASGAEKFTLTCPCLMPCGSPCCALWLLLCLLDDTGRL